MMTIRIARYSLILISFAFLFTGNLPGQRKDFRTWFEAEFDKGLKSGVDISAEIEQRLKNNSLSYDRTLLTLSADYKLTPYMNVEGGMRALLTYDRELNLQGRYRLHADATGSYTLSGVDLSLRIRGQYGFDDLDRIGALSDNTFINRNRVKADYHIFGTKLGIFASLESWHMLSGKPARRTYRIRYSAGVLYALNFRSEFSIRYILEDEFNIPDPLQSHILVIAYSHTL